MLPWPMASAVALAFALTVLPLAGSSPPVHAVVAPAPDEAAPAAAPATAPAPPPTVPAPSSASVADLEAKVKAIFDDQCTMCHSKGGDLSDPGGLPLDGAPSDVAGQKS